MRRVTRKVQASGSLSSTAEVHVISREAAQDAWRLRGVFFADGPVQPGEVRDAPPLGTVVQADSFTVTKVFTCTAPGPVDVFYDASQSGPVIETVLRGPSLDIVDSRPVQWVSGTIVSTVVECIVEPSPTPTDTPTPTQNRPPVIEQFQAARSPPNTVYRVGATDPDGDKLTYAWSNSNTCGQFQQVATQPANAV